MAEKTNSYSERVGGVEQIFRIILEHILVSYPLQQSLFRGGKRKEKPEPSVYYN